ncbi:stalk domain-containing protein [Caldalkalibacillus salinus]|uniref:stalk domain-containing protein n=1 Tax=Caldalkalibacillus salinus TaxID=2803787 RepID=UPI0019239F23|nr:stalk domain-containing protein [Caldalkalibacillus salinus]
MSENTRKLWTLTLLISISGISFFGISTLASNAISLFVGGEKVETDVSPQVLEGRVLVPIRVVAESL